MISSVVFFAVLSSCTFLYSSSNKEVIQIEQAKKWQNVCRNTFGLANTKGSCLILISCDLAFRTNDWVLRPKNYQKFDEFFPLEWKQEERGCVLCKFTRSFTYEDCVREHVNTYFLDVMHNILGESYIKPDVHIAIEPCEPDIVWVTYRKILLEKEYDYFIDPDLKHNLSNAESIIIFARGKADAQRLSEQFPDAQIIELGEQVFGYDHAKSALQRINYISYNRFLSENDSVITNFLKHSWESVFVF